MTKLSLVIPCYQNEKNIPVTGAALIAMEKRLPRSARVEYIFVDDGSGDGTVSALSRFQKKYPKRVTVVKLPHNIGANNATLAGLPKATGDCIVVMAADLQDPPELIPKMFAYWREGTPLVIAARTGRNDAFPTAILANTFHTLMRLTVCPTAPKQGFDLALFDRKLHKDILARGAKNVSFSYLLLSFGYPFVTIPYVRRKREIGHSQWTLAKRIRLSIDTLSFFIIEKASHPR